MNGPATGDEAHLGLFGGTFDPVHNAHLFVAEAVRVALGLGRVLFLPTSDVHHREPPLARTADRLAMLRAAIASNPAFALDESDLGPRATGYTADLIPLLRARYPGARFTFIVGGDSLLDSPWERFEEVLEALDAFAIAPRKDRPVDALDPLLATLPPHLRERVLVLDLPPLAGSATLVRAQMARGGSIRYVVPDAVARYIEERGLYRELAGNRAD